MKRILTFLILIAASGTIFSQSTQMIVDQDFNSRPLQELIQYAGYKYNTSFYYAKLRPDTILVIQKSVPESLDKILGATLENTGIAYYADNQNIILTSNYIIKPDLPPSFFVTQAISQNKPEQPAVSSFLAGGQNNAASAARPAMPSLITVGIPGKFHTPGSANVSGVVTEQETGQPIAGAVVFAADLSIGALTDQYGYYLLILPPGKHDLRLRYLGRKDQLFTVNVVGDGKLDLAMEEKLLELHGVVISADKDFNVRGLQLGLEKLDIQKIKQVSSSMGEGDLMKVALLLPGVKTVGEGASGFNVRGGSADQNLVLMDGSPVFNSSHMFGFFSVFNPDVVKDFSLYKSGIPAQYGGRLSSVLDVNVRSGDFKKYSGYGGISPVSCRLTAEGPIIKDKASFLIGLRSSYSDWVMRRTDIPTLKNSDASFIDLNGKIDIALDKKDHLTISGYFSQDHFRLNSDTLYKYQNINAAMHLKHNFSDKFFGLASVVYSRYSYDLSSNAREFYSFDMNYFINYLEGRTDFTWFAGMKHKVTFGLNVIHYRINPGSMIPGTFRSLIAEKKIPDEKAVEAGIYINDEYDITDNLSVGAGMRYSGFMPLGPAKVYSYQPDAPRTIFSRIDSSYYGNNKIIDYQGGPELRLILRYKTSPSASVKLSYNKMNQFLQMMSNTTAISPTDIWKISGPNLAAQKGHQFSAGYYQYLMANKLLVSAEVYYKTSRNILDYRGGTILVMNPDLEVDLLQGTGRAYGVELMLKKEYGAFNGWLSYTYSRSLIKVDSKFIADRINQGNFFPANYDRPHDITLVSNYRFSRIHSISTTLTYCTGRPITFPVAKYRYRDREIVHYSDRNEYRIPDYFRWDASLNFEGKLNKTKLWQHNLSISVYNITGRNNAYSVFFVSSTKNGVKGYLLSVFSQPIATVTYDFRF